MQTVLVTFGTRPEAIKMAPIVAALREHEDRVKTVVCVTGQHREMLDQVLQRFDLTPDIDLDLMTPGQTPAEVTARVLVRMTEVIQQTGATDVVVQGDTTTAMATALAAFYQQKSVAHVEAGLRSHRMDAPFPEEMNRVVIDSFADLLFPPTPGAAQNLARAEVPMRRVLVTGNTSIDAILDMRRRLPALVDLPIAARFGDSARLVLITAHRRENFGAPLADALNGIEQLARAHPDVTFVYPVHPNPQVLRPVGELLSAPNLHTIEPVEYAELVWLLERSELVISDSGGLQEEAPTLGTPILVLREVTERPELIESGAGILLGTSATRIVSEGTRLLADEDARKRMGAHTGLFGDGRAAVRIALALCGDPVTPWAPS